MSERPARLQRLAAPGLAALMILCCLAGPLLIGAAGALTAGAVFGVGTAVLVLLGLCLLLARRLRSDQGPRC